MISEKFILSTIQWILAKGTKICFILVLAFVINRIFQKLIRKIIISKVKNIIKENEKKKRIETLIGSLGGTLRFLIWLIAILMILPEFGVQITPILTSLGILGLAIGMGAKDMISDFISGFFILLEGQIFIDDKVKIGGVEGKVVDFNLRRTVIEDENGFLHFIPNSQIKIVSKKIK